MTSASAPEASKPPSDEPTPEVPPAGRQDAAGWLGQLAAETAPLRALIHRVPSELLGLGSLIVAQAGWLVLWCSRGWFYQDDFPYLVTARHSSFTWSYLTQHTGGHLIPGFWVMAWLIAHVFGLHYLPTVILRLVLQAAATLLLYRIVRELSGSARRSLAIVAIYCASPLIVPGTLYLSQAMTLLTAQLFSLIAIAAVIRHSKTGSLRSALVAGIALLATAGSWEKTGIDTALVVILLVLGWLTPGGLWARARAVLRDWKGWLLTLGPIVGFGIVYLTQGYATSATGHTPLKSELHLAWIQWSRDICLALIGGPWRWGIGPDVYTGFGTPTNFDIALGQVAFGVLTVLVVWLYGWRRILAWLLPAVPVVVGMAVVAAGRYVFFGQIIAVDYHYAFDLAVPLTLAVALGWRVGPRRHAREQGHARPSRLVPRRLRSGDRRIGLAALPAFCVVVVVAVIGSSAVSARRWTNPWHTYPAKAYVSTLRTQANRSGVAPALYDTFVSQRVLPAPDKPLSLSDFLGLAKIPATFDGSASNLQLVDDHGNIVPATYVPAATGQAATKPVCPTLISGVKSVTLPLSPTLKPNYYFLRLQYLQNTVSSVTVTVKTTTGANLPVANGTNVRLGQSLGTQTFKLPLGAPASVTIAGVTAATNVCASNVSVGLPVAAQQ